MNKNTDKKKILSDKEIRELVIARLSVLSPDTIVSLGSEGSFTREQLVKSVENGDKIGEKVAEIQMEWLRSFKERI